MCDNYKIPSLVSFLVATYNRARLVGECISSIISQTYPNIEIIVVDDASCDDTEEIINKEPFKKVRYYKNDKNRGVAYSRNLGLSFARGKYIGLLDSDDLLIDKGHVEKSLRILEASPGISMVTSDVHCLDLDGSQICEKTFFQTVIDHRDADLSSGIKDFEYIFCHGIHSCGTIFRNEVTEEIGFLNTDYRIAWDEDFFLRLSVHKPRSVYYCNEPRAGYRIHPGNISSNSSCLYSERIRCRRDILNRENSLERKLGRKANKRMAELYLCLVDAYLKERKITAACYSAFKSISLYPYLFREFIRHGFSYGNPLRIKR